MSHYIRSFAATVCLVMFFALSGCSQKIDTAPQEPVWDRTVCEHCHMILSDRHFAAQIVDPTTGKHHFFDDLGCALVWLDQQKDSWVAKAIIYATTVDTGKWVDVKKAVIAKPFVTPMSYGLGVFENANTVPEGKTVVPYEQALSQLQMNQPQGHMHH